MEPKINVGIVGYGNLGKGAELAILQQPDMALAAVFSRRDPSSLSLLTAGVKGYYIEELSQFKGSIDVLLLCGGSASDLPEMTPRYARDFHVVDSFDTHAKIPQHFALVDTAARAGGKVAIISVGWDPGLFSLNRGLAEAILPKGSSYTFWGKGISQGHSDALRRLAGVADARQYTVPSAAALEQVRSGAQPLLTTREKHTRVCYVVAEPSADTKAITQQIITMPDYFADYDTTVHFITQQELDDNHAGMPHGGLVLHSGHTGAKSEHAQLIEYRLTLDSNPEFTASVLTAYARAAVRLGKQGVSGCKTILDIAPTLIMPDTPENLRKRLL